MSRFFKVPSRLGEKVISRRRPLTLSSCAIAVVLLTSVAAPGVSQQQVNDSSFSATVRRPAYTQTHPRVLIDAAHRNVFTTMTERLQPFMRLLKNDGYDPQMGRRPFDRTILDSSAIVVIATAQGSSTDTSAQSAFADDEIAALKGWILDGGSLLLASDHFPFDASAAKLITALGAVGGEGFVRDSAHSYHGSDVVPESLSAWLVFSHDNGLLGEHPILRGRDSSEAVTKVVTFGGTSVTGPKDGKSLLTLSASATNNPRDKAPPRRLGKQQGAAFILGRGRVVLLADATMLTAQQVQTSGYSFKLGMARPDNDDKQFALNVVHWLSGLLDRVVNLPSDPRISPSDLLRAVESGDGAAWGSALTAAGRGPSSFVTILPRLGAEAHSTDPERRRRAIMAISVIGSVGNPWGLDVASTLADSSPAVRYEALLAAAKIDPGNKLTFVKLLELATDTAASAADAQRALAGILGRTRHALSPKFEDSIREMLRSPSALTRQVGLRVSTLSATAWSKEEAHRLLRDPAPSVREEAVYDLDDDLSARADFERLASTDTARAVREAAADVLSYLGQPPSLPGLCANHRPVHSLIPMDFTVEQGSVSLKSDDAGVYRQGEDGVRSSQSYAYNLLLPYAEHTNTPFIKADSGAARKSRYLRFDLSSPVPNGGGLPLGVIADSTATFHTFYMIDDSQQIWNLRDLPVGARVMSDRAEMTLDIAGRLHSIQFGPWALGQCREKYAHQAVLHGAGTTPVVVERLSSSEYRINAPEGSIARLWERGDLSDIKDRGLYYFSFSVRLRQR